MTEIIYTTRAEKFVRNLPKKCGTKVAKEINLLQEYGYKLKLPHIRTLTKGIYELRIKGSLEIRLFYKFKGGKAYIFDYHIKKTQKLPNKVLKKVIEKSQKI